VSNDVKAQPVRLLDVFVFGPMMVYGGTKVQGPQWLRWGLVGLGVGTSLYNAHNYMEVERRQRRKKRS
jgi:hypothetical protein